MLSNRSCHFLNLGCRLLTNAILKDILRCDHGSLRILNIVECRKITAPQMEKFKRTCRGLVELQHTAAVDTVYYDCK